MPVPINQVIAFTTVARKGSFAEAALQLHLSQPALSIAIKNLETSLGGKLFTRTTRLVEFTPEGKAFYPVARRLLSDWEQSIQDVRNHFALRRGKLDIAAIPTYTSNKLPAILAKFHQAHPDINVTVHDVVAENVIEMVREGRCELGITFDPSNALDLDFTALFDDKFVAILPDQHPLTKKAQLTWREVLAYPHISLQRPAGTRELIERRLKEQGFNLAPAFETHQITSIGRMVNQGLGVSVVPSTSLPQMREMGLVSREITAPEINYKMGIVTRRQQALSVAASAMSKLIKRQSSEGYQCTNK